MKHSSRIVASLLVIVLAGIHSGCKDRARAPEVEDATHVAIMPFRASGSAESGQYGLLLAEFSSVLAARLGTVSNWQIMETERLDALEAEQKLEAPEMPAESTVTAPTAADGGGANDEPAPAENASQWAASFPAADYILMGHIRGFDVRPVDSRNGGATMARRQNRVQSRIDVRIVDVRNRTWLASRSIRLDERLADDSAAETQINQAMSLAAAKVASAVLLAVAHEFEIVATNGETLTLNGGTRHGVEPDMVLRATGTDTPSRSAQVQITETFPDRAVATVVRGEVAVGDRVLAQAVESDADASTEVEPRIAVGRFFLAGADPDSQIGGSLVDQIKQELLLNLHRYSGLRVVEDRTGAIKDLLSKQMLEDLSKGRDPGLPLGSLHGVDYLVFGNVSAYDIVQGRREATQMFGATIVTDVPPQALFDGTVYILDVSRGEYITASNLSLDLDLRGQTPARAMATAARAIGADMFRKTLLEIRPLSIIDVQQNEVVLNHTQAIGLAVGDRYTAMSRGQDRVDPNTGTWMRNVGGQELGELRITGFDAGGWAHAEAVQGALPPVGALLVRVDDGANKERSSRRLGW